MFAHTCGVVSLFDSSDEYDHHGTADGWGGFRRNTGLGYAHGSGDLPGITSKKRLWGESQENGTNNGAGSAYGQGRDLGGARYDKRNVEVN